MPAIWRAFMKMNGLDPRTLQNINIDASARAPILVINKMASVDQFLIEKMKTTVDFINMSVEVAGEKLAVESLYRPGSCSPP